MKTYEIIDKLKELREKVDFPARYISKIIGMTDGYITRIEHNNISLSMEAFLKILGAYNLTPVQFFSSKFDEALKDKDLLSKLNKILWSKWNALGIK